MNYPFLTSRCSGGGEQIVRRFPLLCKEREGRRMESIF